MCNRSASSKGRRGSRSRSSSPETGAGGGKSSTSGGGGGAKGRPLFAKPISRALNMSATAKVVGCLRSNVLTILNILGVFSGVVVALILRASREEKWTQREIVYVGFVGKKELRATQSIFRNIGYHVILLRAVWQYLFLIFFFFLKFLLFSDNLLVSSCSGYDLIKILIRSC